MSARRVLRDRRGMTLLEILIGLTILAAIAVVLVVSLRVGLRAWEAGEERAAVQQELRAVVELVTEALATSYPYQGRLGEGLDRVVLFQGQADEVRFVTTAPPLVLDVPAAPFHAVTLRYTEEDHLSVVERLVPTDEPFGDDPRTVLSRAVAGLKLAYLDDTGTWRDEWEGREERALPAAVRVELVVRHQGRSLPVPAFVVPIPLGKAE